ENLPCSLANTMLPVIRKPEITKKTSTPTKPPASNAGSIWKKTTAKTAKARKPSISARYVPTEEETPHEDRCSRLIFLFILRYTPPNHSTPISQLCCVDAKAIDNIF